MDVRAVRDEAVLEKGLAVVGGHHQPGVLEQSAVRERSNEAADLFVRVANLAIVEARVPIGSKIVGRREIVRA